METGEEGPEGKEIGRCEGEVLFQAGRGAGVSTGYCLWEKGRAGGRRGAYLAMRLRWKDEVV